jgi:tRNA-modifying protein YgfZ
MKQLNPMPENPAPSDNSRSATDSASVDGVAALTQFGMIQFSGNDAAAFLQGQLSCDVSALQTGHAVYGSYNTAKGRMLASFLLWRTAAAYLMQLPHSLVETTCKRLSQFVLRSKVKISDVSKDYALLGLNGESAAAALAQLFGDLPVAALSLHETAGAFLLRLDAARFHVVAHPERAAEILKMLVAQIPPISADTWAWTSIRAGIPYLMPATQDQFVPQMANMDLIGGVSFSKGCYPGQEIVARMHYLGKLKQRMYRATVASDNAPQPGDRLYSPDTGEQATGMIVNAAPDPAGGHAVLAVMHIESFLGKDVHLKSPDGPRLEFAALPYAIPS